jgi:hypothetical protein
MTSHDAIFCILCGLVLGLLLLVGFMLSGQAVMP